MEPLAQQRRTPTIQGGAALVAYVIAALCFTAGLIWDQDEAREVGLGIAILGLALDMRHHTNASVARLVRTYSLWQDGECGPSTNA